MTKCTFCKKQFKGKRGVGIHHFYCDVKKFVKKEFLIVGSAKLFINNPWFIRISGYPDRYIPFIENGEIGMLDDKRLIVLKNDRI